MPIDHLLIRVPANKFEQTVTFYTTILGTLGYSKKLESAGAFVGFGEENIPVPSFSITAKGNEPGGNDSHFSFTAKGMHTARVECSFNSY
jgi:hypothetical protein